MKSPGINDSVKPDFNIYITDPAQDAVRKLINEKPNPDRLMLRLGIEGGGCSGLSYTMELTEERRKLDRLFEFSDLRVVVDARSLLYLGGITVDYSEKLLGGGFRFTNPRAKRSCGCGTSFSV
jgi:iron-sulfur cluster assembly protein